MGAAQDFRNLDFNSAFDSADLRPSAPPALSLEIAAVVPGIVASSMPIHGTRMFGEAAEATLSRRDVRLKAAAVMPSKIFLG
jgi:hypothetical protein